MATKLDHSLQLETQLEDLRRLEDVKAKMDGMGGRCQLASVGLERVFVCGLKRQTNEQDFGKRRHVAKAPLKSPGWGDFDFLRSVLANTCLNFKVSWNFGLIKVWKKLFRSGSLEDIAHIIYIVLLARTLSIKESKNLFPGHEAFTSRSFI